MKDMTNVKTTKLFEKTELVKKIVTMFAILTTVLLFNIATTQRAEAHPTQCADEWQQEAWCRNTASTWEGDIQYGETGRGVLHLQYLLQQKLLYRGTLDGDYGPQTRASVITFHKTLNLERDGNWHEQDWQQLENLTYETEENYRQNPETRIEVDITRQTLYIITDNHTTAVIGVSTGNGAAYWSKNGNGGKGGTVHANTPRGTYTIFKHIDGWRHTYLGGLYEPWYFTPYYAVHGSNNVPAYPASHGCVRIPNWEAAKIENYIELGTKIHIWDNPPN